MRTPFHTLKCNCGRKTANSSGRRNLRRYGLQFCDFMLSKLSLAARERCGADRVSELAVAFVRRASGGTCEYSASSATGGKHAQQIRAERAKVALDHPRNRSIAGRAMSGTTV